MTHSTDLRVLRTAFADVVELIPQRARTVLYIGSVVLAALVLATQRVVAIWLPEYQDQVDATVAEILPWVLALLGVLATAYRPTRGTSPGPVPVSAETLNLAEVQAIQAQTIATLCAQGWSRKDAVAAVTADSLELLIEAVPVGPPPAVPQPAP